jgi:hypothetical protein
VAFGINVRFAIPALLVGLCLLPVSLRAAGRPRGWWILFAALLALLVVTNESWDLLRSSERLSGIVFATLLVIAPAALILLARRAGRRSALAGGIALGLLIAGVGYEVQRDYLRDRYQRFEPASDFSKPYAWAADLENRSIGLAGTSAGFTQYGLYGKRLSNELTYLGREADAGGFDAIPTCGEFRAAVNGADLDFLVTSPFLNFIDPGRPIASPEAGWLRGVRAVQPILRDGDVTVWRIDGRLDPSACGPGNAPLRYVPDQPSA